MVCTTALAAFAQAGRIYTAPDPNATGGIAGNAGTPLTHAMAVEHSREHVYLATLGDGGQSFRFEHLPVGKYDLVLVSKDGAVYEGLALGGPADGISAVSRKNLETRISLADSFFNLYAIHRLGLEDSTVLAFVERISTKHVLKQSGEALNQNLRRLEVIELHQASDDWQMVATRHLYREGEEIVDNPSFFKHAAVPALGNLRVVDSVKDLGALPLPKL
jgi:hypothetical protein